MVRVLSSREGGGDVATFRYRQRWRSPSVVRVLSPREGGGDVAVERCTPNKDDFRGEDIAERGVKMATQQQNVVAQTKMTRKRDVAT